MPEFPPPSEPTVRRLDDPQALPGALAAAVAAHLRAGCADRGTATLCLGGGTFIPTFLAALATERLDWSRLTLILGDERFVPLDSADSNEGGLRRTLRALGVPMPKILGLRGTAATPDAAAQDASRRLAPFWRQPMDAVLLGLGADGHTASLFPDAPAEALSRALDPSGPPQVYALESPTSAGPRLTLTVPALLTARAIWVHAHKPDRMVALHAAMGDGPVAEKPIRAILGNGAVPVHVFGLAD